MGARNFHILNYNNQCKLLLTMNVLMFGNLSFNKPLKPLKVRSQKRKKIYREEEGGGMNKGFQGLLAYSKNKLRSLLIDISSKSILKYQA